MVDTPEPSVEPEPLFDAIGRVIAESANLEGMYTRMVAEMAGGGPQGCSLQERCRRK
jgi:hypothetical protein